MPKTLSDYLPRNHYFFDEDNNRTVVETQMTIDGGFRAVVIDGEGGEFIAFGFGHSRLAAIADLNDNIRQSELLAQPSANHKHFFRDENDNQTVVITTLLPNGEYGAYREDEDEGRCRGFGHSRIAAIVDLQGWIEDQG